MTSQGTKLHDVLIALALKPFFLTKMAEVAPRESIMSLVTEKFEPRRVLKGINITVEPVIEDYSSCFNCSGDGEAVEETTESANATIWCLEPVNSVEKQAERVASMEVQNGEKNEEKPHLKRQNNSLEWNLVEGERSLKKMKISNAEPQDVDLTA